MRGVLRTLAAGVTAAVLVTLGGVATGAPGGARAGDCVADGSVQTGAIFNQPHDDDNGDDRIHRHIVCLIDGAPAGSEIRVATYHFAHKAIKDALLRAHARQVKVKVLVDHGAPANADDGPIYKELQNVIDDDKRKDSWITTCLGDGVGDDNDRACIGNAKMHNKLLLFSQTHGVANVTFLTSSNLEDDDAPGNSGTDMWNSGYTAAADSALYNHFYGYFDALSGWENGQQTDPEDLNYYATAKLPVQAGNYTVYHSPRQEGSTALDILDKVECHGNSSGGTNPGNRTIIRVAVWQISGNEDSDPGTRIAQRLWELDNEGCYVDVVADIIDDDEHGPLRALLQKPQADYHGPEVREFNGDEPHGLHQKNMLIDGFYDGKPDQKVVFTGSYHFTYRSVRVNDETWLQVNDPGVHDRFLDNFADVRNAAHTCWQTSKPAACDGGRAVDADPPTPLNCHETADKYQDSGNVYLYGADYCGGANGAKDDSGEDSDYGDGAGQVKDFDNKTVSIVNTTGKTVEFYNYPDYNAGHPEGDTFCLRPGQWVNRTVLYGDNQGTWQSSISSHRLVDDPATECDRWFGGFHQPHR